MDCKKEINMKECNCTYPCKRKGMCCECVKYHRDRNQFPACFFSNKTEALYDRSFEALIRDRKGKK